MTICELHPRYQVRYNVPKYGSAEVYNISLLDNPGRLLVVVSLLTQGANYTVARDTIHIENVYVFAHLLITNIPLSGLFCH